MWGDEEHYWAQRSKNDWLKEGDKNTKFFHLSTLQRRSRNRISKIRKSDGSWIIDETQVRGEINKYFRDLYFAEPTSIDSEVQNAIPHLVNDQINLALLAPITEVEVKKAINQLGRIKAPGPEGFPGIFFQQIWNLISVDVVRMVKNFFEIG